MEREKIEREINQVRSKYGEKILYILKSERSMYHGDLAAKLEISPSGLNAIIKKMTEGEIPLVRVEQVGKFKKYSLPDEVRQYMENENPEQQGTGTSRKVCGAGLFLPVQRFVEAAGESWREILNLLLCGEEAGISQDVIKVFGELIKQMEELYVTESPELRLLRKFIKNEVLLYLLDEYLLENSKTRKNPNENG